MIKYCPTKRGVFAKRIGEPTYTLAMAMAMHTVNVTAVESPLTDAQIRYAAMAWYPNATDVKIER